MLPKSGKSVTGLALTRLPISMYPDIAPPAVTITRELAVQRWPVL